MADDSSEYHCMLSGACGSPVYSDAAYMFVFSTAPAYTTQPSDTAIIDGFDATFTIAATNASQYQWQESTDGGSTWSDLSNGGVYSNVTAETLNITAATASMHGNFYRCVTSGCGSTNSDTVKLSICGETLSFNGLTYGTVISGCECWLDRNLGATQVGTSKTDAAAFGYLYQWGRGNDGHEVPTSGTTTTQSSTDSPGHGDFIIGTSDWRNPVNDNLWIGVDGVNNPCPNGFRIPTSDEWTAELNSWSDLSDDGAFASDLKLSNTNSRMWTDGSIASLDINYWVSTRSAGTAIIVDFDPGNSAHVYEHTDLRAYGFAVRCIKD